MSLLYLIFALMFTQTTRIISARENKKVNNILLIFVDDLRPLADQNITLVNIRKVAEKGVSFKNAFAQQALCAPSRNSLLTGRRPDTLHLYDFYSYWRQTVGNFSTLPQFFKQNGYDTYSVGKVFHPGASSNYKDDYPYSWSKHPYHPPAEKYRNAAACKDPTTKKLQKNLICPVTVKTQPGKSLPDMQSLEYAIKLLKQKRNSAKPFLLAVGFHKPHIPLKFPKSYLEKVPKYSVQPPAFPSIPNDLPPVAWQGWTDIRDRDDIKRLNLLFPYGIMPKDWAIKIRQSYYAAALYVDHLIGKLMRHVDMKKTIVVLTSDHGWSLGENGLWAKYSNFDAALRVPLIFIVPKFKPKLIHAPVELLDIFPTLVELSGLPNNITKCDLSEKSILCFDGHSLVPLIKSSEDSSNEAFAISQYPRPSGYPQLNSDRPRLKDIKIMGYSIRTKRYRYTEWISFNSKLFTRNWSKLYGVELYDHESDPQESNNLHLKLEYEHIRRYLSNLLRLQVEP